MPNPRNTVRFDGIDANQVTFIIDGATITYDGAAAGGSPVVGRAVALSANKTVKLAADGERVLGKLVKVESDGKCAVQEEGYADLPGGDGATLTAGRKFVGALGPAGALGYIRAIVPATLADVAAGDGEIVDAANPARVYVKF